MVTTLNRAARVEAPGNLDASRGKAPRLARNVDTSSGRERTDAVQELRGMLEPVSSLPLACQVEEAYCLGDPALRADSVLRVLSGLDNWSFTPEPLTMALDDSVWQDWAIPGWLPARRATRLCSQGGSRKNCLALELACAIAALADP